MGKGTETMRLWAVSDLHLSYAANRDALADLRLDASDDWLIVAGDVGETEADLRFAWDILCARFGKVIWVPGNHELWARPGAPGPTGVAKYEQLVAVCRGVLTPEDEYPVWPGEGPPTFLVPLFLLYDYSFAPDGMGPAEARRWAMADGIECADERLLSPAPYATIEDWCRARLELTRPRLAALPGDQRTVLINHFPLRRDLVRLHFIPRFIPWCGTRQTEDWHVRFRADVVVSGHLHMRSTDLRDGTRFEEVSLGYPRHWQQSRGVAAYLRRILPRIPCQSASDAVHPLRTGPLG